MASPVITVDPKMSLRDAEQRMHDHDIACVAVISGERLVGIVTKLDFPEPISALEAAAARKFSVQFGVKGVDVSADQQAFMMNEFDSFTHRFQEAFQLGTLFVYMKSHGDNGVRDTPLVHCRLQFRTARGTFSAQAKAGVWNQLSAWHWYDLKGDVTQQRTLK